MHEPIFGLREERRWIILTDLITSGMYMYMYKDIFQTQATASIVYLLKLPLLAIAKENKRTNKSSGVRFEVKSRQRLS